MKLDVRNRLSEAAHGPIRKRPYLLLKSTYRIYLDVVAERARIMICEQRRGSWESPSNTQKRFNGVIFVFIRLQVWIQEHHK
jgi:hypothetical protein